MIAENIRAIERQTGILWVKYDSELNEMAFNKITSLEYDLIFTIIALLKDKQKRNLVISFKDFKKIAQIKNNLTLKQLESIIKNLFKVEFYYLDDTEYVQKALFDNIKASTKTKIIEIDISNSLYNLINSEVFNKTFTYFNLDDLLKLKSVYSKTAYRLLAQFQTTGIKVLSTHDFNRLFDIPSSYDFFDIKRRVFSKIEDELKYDFKNLEIKRINNDYNNFSYRFTFDKIKLSSID